MPVRPDWIPPARFIMSSSEELKRNRLSRMTPTVPISFPGWESVILKACKASGIHIDELRSGGRRQKVFGVWSRLAVNLVRNHGISLAETARQLGVSTPAIWNLLMRKGDKS